MNKATASGALFAGGWFLFLDGLLSQAALHRVPQVSGFADWAPGIVASLGFGAIVAVPLDALAAALDPYDAGVFASSRARHCAACSLFVAFSVGFAAIMMAVALLQLNYVDRVHPVVRDSAAYCAWPAQATLLQTVAIFAAALLALTRRFESRGVFGVPTTE